MFRKILIANRGEIAVRIIRACRELGITTVAVYSEADRASLHVQLADEAYAIGPAPPLESYLCIDTLLDVAKKAGAEAVHPGYGFLAENARFARMCRKWGIVFIGPEADAIQLLGDKIASRKTLSKTRVPLIPGMRSESRDLKSFEKHGDKIGYPLMVKASAGGGGKGMRIVHSSRELKQAIEAGRREAEKAFGDDTVYLEKYIANPRHIEFQILADHHGHAVHLFERECSIQRRHQKIVEETPSPVMDPELRKLMGAAALEVVTATGYTNAGTVEFLLDDEKHFYFLEVNTRIQVEHPVTEMVTGVDLVKEQIRIAAGEPLSFTQDDLTQNGHAIECRIYAEDPENQFLPSLGQIQFVQNPDGPGVRLDSGIYSGSEITLHYDPILSKLITWGNNRDVAISRMVMALSDYIILGIKTTVPFLKEVIVHPKFKAGNVSTAFIDRYYKSWKPDEDNESLHHALIAAALFGNRDKHHGCEEVKSSMKKLWQQIGARRIGG